METNEQNSKEDNQVESKKTKIQINYDAIPDELFGNYLENLLIGRFYKLLCMREEESQTLSEYLESFMIELRGSEGLIVSLKYDPNLHLLLSILQYFIENSNLEVAVYKREVFKCIDIVKKLQERYLNKTSD